MKLNFGFCSLFKENKNGYFEIIIFRFGYIYKRDYGFLFWATILNLHFWVEFSKKEK